MERRTSTISALPDEILCHILSFLPTKTSISTSVLAKRWRFLWAHVPNIDLDDSQQLRHRGLGTRFSDIVYRVMLMYRVQSIDHFRLSYKDSPCSEYQLETCIDTAIARNVKNLYLDLGNQVRLSPRIFTYKALVELKLFGCGDIPSPSSTDMYLPALKILHLASVVYASDKSLEHLLSGCPVLQELFVLRTNVDPLVFCYISSSTLRKIVLFTHFINNRSYAVTYRVRIDAPALTHLELQDTISKDISVGPLTSLIAADIQFHNRVSIQGDDVLYYNSVVQLVTRLSNVKTLKLCTTLLQVPLPAFSILKVKFLKLTSLALSGDWRFILFFLIRAKNLEVLTIQMVTNDGTLFWCPRIARILMSSLALIKIDQFSCTQHEFDLIAYLLKNAKVLKMMEVYPHPIFRTNFRKKFEALNQISSFQRGSEECKVVFKD